LISATNKSIKSFRVGRGEQNNRFAVFTLTCV